MICPSCGIPFTPKSSPPLDRSWGQKLFIFIHIPGIQQQLLGCFLAQKREKLRNAPVAPRKITAFFLRKMQNTKHKNVRYHTVILPYDFYVVFFFSIVRRIGKNTKA